MDKTFLPGHPSRKLKMLNDSKSALTASPARLKLSSQTKGVLLLAVAILMWGANWPVMKSGLNHITPIWFSTLRFALGAACLFVIQAATGKLIIPKRHDVPLIASVGLLQMMTFTVLGAVAMTHVDAGRSAVLAYTTPLWVLPIAVLLLHERLSRREFMGTFMGVMGVLILFNPLSLDWSNRPLVQANFMLLAASLCWALSMLHLRYSRNSSSAYQLAPWQMALACIPLSILSWWVEGPYTGDGSRTLWEILLFMGPLATAFCFCAVNAASSWLSSTSMSTAMLGVPVVGLMMSVLFTDEVLTLPLLLGVLAILVGILVTITRHLGSAN